MKEIMLKRKAYSFLLDWRRTKNAECLLIKGARQTGKTYLVEAFGRNEYQSFIEINFLENPQLKQIFEGSISAKDIYKKIRISTVLLEVD